MAESTGHLSVILDLMEKIVERPQMFASTPEEANGQIIALSWIALQIGLQLPPHSYMEVFKSIMFETMKSVYPKPGPLVSHLCDTIPASLDGKTFDAIRSNGKQFMSLLIARVESASTDAE